MLEDGMLIKERLEIPGEKHDDATLRWLVMAGVGVLSAFWLQDVSQRYLGMDFLQALGEFAFLLLILAVGVGANALLASLLARLFKRSSMLWAAITAVCLVPMVFFLAYSHLAMSLALVPIKTDFRQAAGCVYGAGGDCAKEMDQVLAHRDSFLREYGYARIGAWHVSRDGVDCQAVYLFTAGVAGPH